MKLVYLILSQIQILFFLFYFGGNVNNRLSLNKGRSRQSANPLLLNEERNDLKDRVGLQNMPWGRGVYHTV